jgi:apolipoprotein N-acyltransferase
VDGQRGESLQQLAMARIRAVETDRAVVVASTTGVSAIIAPDGRLLASTGTWRQAEIEARVPLRTTITLADKIGGWPEALITFATLAALVLALADAIRDRRRRPAPTALAGASQRDPEPVPGRAPESSGQAAE